MEALSKKPSYQKDFPQFQEYFNKLLSYRISLFTQVKNYEDIHYLNIGDLSRVNRREIREILRNGKKIHQFIYKASKE